MNKYLYILIIILLPIVNYAQRPPVFLHTNWKFRQAGDAAEHPAVVPGTVHSDLLRLGLIPDPNYGDNENLVRWVEEKDWEYSVVFMLKNKDLQAAGIDLVCEGLDTYATVKLNGTVILTAGNMFRTWRIPVKQHLRFGGNTLQVTFSPAAAKGKALAGGLPYTLPGEEKVFTRKAQYQYGWDWGPRLVTAGIWRPVYLEFTERSVLAGIHLRQLEVTPDLASLLVDCEIRSVNDENLWLRLSGSSGEPFRKDSLVALKQGNNLVSIPLRLASPALWYPNGSADAGKLSLFTVELISGREVISTRQVRTGLRSVELVQEKDSIGKGFQFVINGKPLFIKGANYIPPGNFLPSVDTGTYRKLLEDARDANINMLRVWGGGTYEQDYFYRLCDELGILVWQDFMFACAMYPGDSAFLENVRQEIRDNVIRLRNFGCIALWCGNNEIDEGWHNWGWQKQYGYLPGDSAAIWQDYRKLFHELIPATLRELDPGRPYWPSSPSIGWGRKESLRSGDSHYWGVWWGMEPFETYEKKVPRFMSEFGFQGFPDLNTLHAFTPVKDRYLDSPVLKSHQKHPTGYETIRKYMEREYQVPDGLEDYIYVSQLLQACGIRKGIEAHRRAKPRCMGTLYWQLNDCWPVVSWSGIDWYGRWKALHYEVKKAFEPFLVSMVTDSLGTLQICLVNDGPELISGQVKVFLKDFKGKILFSKEYPKVTASPDVNTRIFLPSSEYMKQAGKAGKDRCFLQAVFTGPDHRPASAHLFFTVPRDLRLTDDLSTDVRGPSDGDGKGLHTYVVLLRANTLAKNVWLSTGGSDTEFSDNYFDLLPGDTREITCISPLSNREAFVKTLKIKSLVNIH